jgi:hypothetical protein
METLVEGRVSGFGLVPHFIFSTTYYPTGQRCMTTMDRDHLDNMNAPKPQQKAFGVF